MWPKLALTRGSPRAPDPRWQIHRSLGELRLAPRADHDVARHDPGSAAAAVNQALLVRNWLIWAWIVEFEQFGGERATYGSGLLKRLATDLKASGLRGVSPDLLERMRGFYRIYPQLWPAISAAASRKSLSLPGSTEIAMASEISATVSRKSSGDELLSELVARSYVRRGRSTSCRVNSVQRQGRDKGSLRDRGPRSSALRISLPCGSAVSRRSSAPGGSRSCAPRTAP